MEKSVIFSLAGTKLSFDLLPRVAEGGGEAGEAFLPISPQGVGIASTIGHNDLLTHNTFAQQPPLLHHSM